MDKAALLVLVEQDKNGGAFHTFWEEDRKGLNYSIRDRAEGGAGGALAPPLFCKNKNKLNKK